MRGRLDAKHADLPAIVVRSVLTHSIAPCRLAGESWAIQTLSSIAGRQCTVHSTIVASNIVLAIINQSAIPASSSHVRPLSSARGKNVGLWGKRGENTEPACLGKGKLVIRIGRVGS